MGTSVSNEYGNLNYEAVKDAVITIRAFNHTHSDQILRLLDENKPTIVTDIYNKLRMEESVASQRLGLLRRANIVIASRDSRNVYYSLNRKRIAEIALLVHNLSVDPDAGN